MANRGNGERGLMRSVALLLSLANLAARPPVQPIVVPTRAMELVVRALTATS